MTNNSKPTPPKEYVEAWTSVLCKMGPETVRMRLCNGEVGVGPNAPVKFAGVKIGCSRITPKRDFVEQWLADEDRKSRRRSAIQNILVWVGAFAAAIGAATGLISVLSPYF